jgi:hypothetical protein
MPGRPILPTKSYAFEAPQGADDTLEYRNYQVLVARNWASWASSKCRTKQPKLLVGMKFFTIDHPVRVLQARIRSWPGRTGAGLGPLWLGLFALGYRPFFYDPYRFGPPYVEERIKHQYQRQLRITINGTAPQAVRRHGAEHQPCKPRRT